jgi:predicted metallo-beta-lactamase superfamily hydrolase
MYAKPFVCALFDSLCAAVELFASKALLLAILTKMVSVSDRNRSHSFNVSSKCLLFETRKQ